MTAKHAAHGAGRASGRSSSAHGRHEAVGRQVGPGVGKRKKRHIGRKIVVALLLVVVLIVGAAGAYVFALDARLAQGGSDAAQSSLTQAAADEPFYVLVLGSDSREGSQTSTRADEQGDNRRSDVMMLMRVDRSARQLTIISIPRDTPWVDDTGETRKINEAYNQGGAALSIRAVEELTGEKISQYVEVGFSDLEAVVDALGGVTVNVETELSYKDALTGEQVTIPAGEQTLNGQQAQIFARARHEYGSNQDMHRQNNVRVLIQAIMDKALDRPLYELPGTVLDLAGCVGTSMRTADIASIAVSFAGGMTLYSASGPYDGDLDPAAGDIWLCYRNPAAWERLMTAVDAGEDPSDVDVKTDAVLWQ